MHLWLSNHIAVQNPNVMSIELKVSFQNRISFFRTESLEPRQISFEVSRCLLQSSQTFCYCINPIRCLGFFNSDSCSTCHIEDKEFSRVFCPLMFLFSLLQIFLMFIFLFITSFTVDINVYHFSKLREFSRVATSILRMQFRLRFGSTNAGFHKHVC